MGSVSREVGWLQERLVTYRKQMALASGGVLLGIVLAVAFGGADSDAPVVRVLAAVIGPVLGTALAILGSRALQDRSDRRVVLRAMQAAIAKIEHLHYLLSQLHAVIASQSPSNEPPLNDPIERQQQIDSVSPGDAGNVAGILVALVRVAEHPPNFDVLLETDEDRTKAFNVLAAFVTVAGFIIDDDDWKRPSERAHMFIAIWAQPARHLDRIRLISGLAECAGYFKGRLPAL